MTAPSSERYFLSTVKDLWIEVTKEEFMAAEHGAGFRSKFSGEPATGGFTNGSSRGSVTYGGKDPVSGTVGWTLAQREELEQ